MTRNWGGLVIPILDFLILMLRLCAKDDILCQLLAIGEYVDETKKGLATCPNNV